MFSLALIAPIVNLDSLHETANESTEFEPRQTVGAEFTRSLDEAAEAAELLNADPAEPDWESMAEEAHTLSVVCSGLTWL